MTAAVRDRVLLVVLAAVIFAVIAYSLGTSGSRAILDDRSLSSCAPGFDVAAHPEVLCYPVD